MDEWVFSSPCVFAHSAMALSVEAPSTQPAGWWWVTCLLGTTLSPLAYYTLLLTSQEMTVALQHSQIQTDDLESAAFIQLFSYPSHTIPSVSSKK